MNDDKSKVNPISLYKDQDIKGLSVARDILKLFYEINNTPPRNFFPTVKTCKIANTNTEK